MSQKRFHLNFTATPIQRPNGDLYIPRLHDDERVRLIIEELKDIYHREDKRPLGYNDLPYGSDDHLLEAIGQLEKAIEWPGEPECYGEPPITMAEMHANAFREHQKMHS